jgi:rhamnosyltransferase
MSDGAPAASVIVRSKDEEQAIGRCLQRIRAQSVPVEIILVDSGSTDRTLEIAEPLVDRVIRIAPEDFTFGGALNTGAAAATADVHVAVSAHCFLERDDWIARAVAHFEDPRVAGCWGIRTTPDGHVLTAPLVVEGAELRRTPMWGYTNHASAWRASRWREQPIDEQLVACEDRDWFWRELEAGWTFVADPDLWVSAGHRREAGVRALFRRTRKEALALAQLSGQRSFTARAALRAWWSDLPPGSRRPPLLQRLNYLRATEIAGRWAGERAARRAGSRRPEAR